MLDPTPINFHGRAIALTPQDLVAEAGTLKCGVPIIRAFDDVESGGSGFIAHDGRPTALYEASYFSHFTNGRFDRSHPNLSSPKWNRSLYGPAGAHQYVRLADAMALDREAALKSVSIGRYQVMAANYAIVGFPTLEAMWNAFCDNEQAHLAAFGQFITHAGLLPDLRTNPPKFVALSLGYNGAGEHANGYDRKLQAAWNYFTKYGAQAPPSPVAAYARAVQPDLIGMGHIAAALLKESRK